MATLEEIQAQLDEIQAERDRLVEERDAVKKKNKQLLDEVKPLRSFKAKFEDVDADELLAKAQQPEPESKEKPTDVSEAIRKATAAFQKEVADLKAELQRSEKAKQQTEIKAKALQVLSEIAVKPEHFYKLLETEHQFAIGANGQLVVIDQEDYEVPISTFIENVKSGGEYDYALKQPGKSGADFGAQRGKEGVTTSLSNPFVKGAENLTQQAVLFKQNPEQALRLAQKAGNVPSWMEMAPR